MQAPSSIRGPEYHNNIQIHEHRAHRNIKNTNTHRETASRLSSIEERTNAKGCKLVFD